MDPIDFVAFFLLCWCLAPHRESERAARISTMLKMILSSHAKEIPRCSRSLTTS
jgi:hypothetical protein